MTVDIRTLMLAITVASLVTGLVLFAYWRTQRTYAGFVHWAYSTLLVALMCGLFSLRGLVPDMVSVAAASGCGFAALALRIHGTRLFRGTPTDARLWFLAVIAATTIVGWTAAGSGRLAFRAACISSVVAALAVVLGCAFLSRSGSARADFLAWVFFGLHVAYALAMLARGVAWLVAPDMRVFLAGVHPNAAFHLLELAVDIGAPVLFLALNAEHLTQELAQSQARLEVLAATDALTGAASRRSFLEHLEMEIARQRRTGASLGVLIIDLDHFKAVNDEYGHAAGDLVLRHAVEVMMNELRDMDMLGRIGGEEFGVLLPEAGAEGARGVAERIREAVRTSPVIPGDGTIEVTVSVGVAVLTASEAGVDAILRRADAALYQAKRGGRNQVRVAGA